jgi:cell division septation protein DedD
MGGFLVVLLFSVVFLSHPRLSFAREESPLRLNEVMANPTEGREWVEVYNSSDQEIDLSGWRVDDEEGGSAPVNLEGFIEPGGYLLIETGKRLNNGGDEVRLIDPGDEVVDSFVYSAATRGFSFAREADGSWIETDLPSPGRANHDEPLSTAPPSPTASASAKAVSSPRPSLPPSPSPTLPPTPVPSPTSSPSPSTTPVSGDFEPALSEFAPNPNEGEEWIELYNPYPAALALSGWRLDDREDGGSRPVALSGAIEPRGYLVVAFGTRLNNSGDVVRLVRPDDSEAERFEFDESERGEVWAKDFNGRWQPTRQATPGAANVIEWPQTTPSPSPTPSQTPSQTPSPSPSPSSSPDAVVTPAISSPLPELKPTASPPPVRLAALGIPWCSGGAVLGAADSPLEKNFSFPSQPHPSAPAPFFVIGGLLLGAAGLVLIDREDMVRCSRALVTALASRCHLVVVDFLPFEHPEDFQRGESGV